MATPITLNLRDILTTVNIQGALRLYQNVPMIEEVAAGDKAMWIIMFLRALLVIKGYEEYVKGLSAAEVAVKGWTLIFYDMTKAEAKAEFDSLSDDEGCVLTILGWNEWQDEHDLFKINHEVSRRYIRSILNKFDRI